MERAVSADRVPKVEWTIRPYNAGRGNGNHALTKQGVAAC
jgi:hypothetical protein